MKLFNELDVESMEGFSSMTDHEHDILSLENDLLGVDIETSLAVIEDAELALENLEALSLELSKTEYNDISLNVVKMSFESSLALVGLTLEEEEAQPQKSTIDSIKDKVSSITSAVWNKLKSIMSKTIDWFKNAITLTTSNLKKSNVKFRNIDMEATLEKLNSKDGKFTCFDYKNSSIDKTAKVVPEILKNLLKNPDGSYEVKMNTGYKYHEYSNDKGNLNYTTSDVDPIEIEFSDIKESDIVKIGKFPDELPLTFRAIIRTTLKNPNRNRFRRRYIKNISKGVKAARGMSNDITRVSRDIKRMSKLIVTK